MSKTIHELKEERMRLWNLQQDILKRAQAENRAVSDDENRQFDEAEEDYKKLTRQIQMQETVEKRAAEFAAAQAQDGEGKPAGSDERKRTPAEVEQRMRVALRNFLRSPSLGSEGFGAAAREYQDAIKEYRGTLTQVTTTPSLGGYLVPEFWWQEIIQTMAYYGPMLDAGIFNQIRTSNGSKWNIPTSNQTAVKGALITETTGDVVSDITFGTRALEAYMYTSRVIKASYEMLQDSAYPIENFIAQAAAERLGRIANDHLTRGTGSDQPNGIATASTMGKVSATTNGFTRNDILDLIHSVDVAYRPNGRFMMNDATILAIKKLTVGSADDRPLWQPSIREGEPGTIEGYSYLINNDIAKATDGINSRIMLFGDFKKYTVRVVNGMELKVLNELYALERSVGWFAYMRLDGELLDTAAVKHLRTAAS
jgi:HK97 family phage major capsid protein